MVQGLRVGVAQDGQTEIVFFRRIGDGLGRLGDGDGEHFDALRFENGGDEAIEIVEELVGVGVVSQTNECHDREFSAELRLERGGLALGVGEHHRGQSLADFDAADFCERFGERDLRERELADELAGGRVGDALRGSAGGFSEEAFSGDSSTSGSTAGTRRDLGSRLAMAGGLAWFVLPGVFLLAWVSGGESSRQPVAKARHRRAGNR